MARGQARGVRQPEKRERTAASVRGKRPGAEAERYARIMESVEERVARFVDPGEMLAFVNAVESARARWSIARSHFSGDVVRPDDFTALLNRLDAISERQHKTLDELIPKLQSSHLSKA